MANLRTAAAAAILLCGAVAAAGCGGAAAAGAPSGGSGASGAPSAATVANLQPFADPSGNVATYSTAGSVPETGPFFTPLGGNARACSTCHQLDQGMSISAAAAQALFTASGGTDPLFTAIDGANCPDAATGDAAAHSLIVNKGLVRVALTLPGNAQFAIGASADPYGCAIASGADGQPTVSVYRRPLPATNLAFASAVMWDGRFTLAPLDTPATYATDLAEDLAAQALDAVATHEQGVAAPGNATLAAVVALEEGLYTAQDSDASAGSLSAGGAGGGAAALAGLTYTPGENTAPGGGPGGFNPNVFTLFAAWQNSANPRQASIARGENIFNTAPLAISDVPGVNDNAGLGSPAVVHGSCSSCHSTPNVGNLAADLPMDTGVSHLAATETDPNIVAALGALNPAVLPVYQITGCLNAQTGLAVTLTTTDPGVGLVSGQCADVGRVQAPALRGLAARAPYFHDGAADTLAEVVAFYNARFQMHLSPAQQTDLVNFLGAL